MDFAYSPGAVKLQTQLLKFMDEHIYPAEPKYDAEIAANTAAGKRWTPLATIEALKPKARAVGLWNLFLPPTAGSVIAKALRILPFSSGSSQRSLCSGRP